MPMNHAAAVKEIVRDAMGGEPTFDHLSKFDRDIVGSVSARLNIPLHDGAQTMGSLRLVIAELTRLVANAERIPAERSQLFLVGSTVRHLNKRINAYRLKGKL